MEKRKQPNPNPKIFKLQDKSRQTFVKPVVTSKEFDKIDNPSYYNEPLFLSKEQRMLQQVKVNSISAQKIKKWKQGQQKRWTDNQNSLKQLKLLSKKQYGVKGYKLSNEITIGWEDKLEVVLSQFLDKRMGGGLNSA